MWEHHILPCTLFIYRLVAEVVAEYELYPLTQLSEKTWFPPPPRQPKIDDEGTPEAEERNRKMWQQFASFCAPAAPEGGELNQDLDGTPNLFHGQATCSAAPICARCGVPIPLKLKLDIQELKGVKCDECGHYYHFTCADIRRAPRFGGYLHLV